MGSPGERRFPPQNPVEFDGVADRFVDLQSELRAFEDELLLALLDRRGAEEGGGLLGDALGVAGVVPLPHRLEAARLELPERLRVGATLRLLFAQRRHVIATAALDDLLMDPAALRADKPFVGDP